jgi:hypothetical protein
MNLVPDGYRGVSVARVDVPLSEEGLRQHFLGRPAYRRTRFIVVMRAEAGESGPLAVIEVAKRSDVPLFSEITTVTVIAGQDETAFADAPEADVGIPTSLGRVAAERAPGARCVVVRGRYGHVGFIVDPAPIRIRVVEVVPPQPAKLLDQASRVLDMAEDLPPVSLVPAITDLGEIAADQPAEHYLFPCRAGAGLAEATVSYLDEIPPRANWTLVGCARSRAIHDWFYPDPAPTVDMCPRNLARQIAADGADPVLTKCCLLEDQVTVDGGLVVVPWGASLAQVRYGLTRAIEAATTGVTVAR